MLFTTKEFVEFYNTFECGVAVLIGIFTQIFHTDIRNMSHYMAIFFSSIFIALTIVPFVLEKFVIDAHSTTAVVIYSLSSLASVKLITVFNSGIVKATKKAFKKILGDKCDGI